ncbi:MAG: Ni/Fe-hydrogenase cytochrome b subunit [Candidatus Yanofskybacteria bacterium]|nr:Ni/Fe-hydrogenase cytochrome b subunit [Candidatus Yanofskybacteria bacterium]
MKRRLSIGWLFLVTVLAAGLYSMAVRVFKGLGASTHLSDQFPWGLWVGFDVLCGVALAAGAFTLSGAVYILHLDRYKPLVRAAIMTGFIGYLAAIVGLLFDLGHPYRIWHPLIMWNPHSVMFEISWCVTLYTTVLAVEFSAFVFERLRMTFAARAALAITVPLVILGIILSTLHQSSLGSLFLIVPSKLHPLWYSPWLPIFFFASALAIGCGMVIVESFLSSKAFNMELEVDILSSLGRVLVVVLGVYGLARVIDLTDRGVWYLVAVPGFERCMFLAEILLAPIGAMVLMMMPNARKNRLGLFMGGLMTVAGFILNRFNVSMTGLVRASGTKYVPSWMEISVTLTLVVVAVALFAVAARTLRIFPDAKPCLEEGQTCKDKPSCCLVTPAKLWILAIWVAVGMLIVNAVRDFAAYQPAAVQHEAVQRGPASYPVLPKTLTFTPSADSPGPVSFSHETHHALGACADCHAGRFSILPRGTHSGAGRDMHAPERCGMCHDGKAVSNECTACHAVP